MGTPLNPAAARREASASVDELLDLMEDYQEDDQQDYREDYPPRGSPPPAGRLLAASECAGDGQGGAGGVAGQAGRALEPSWWTAAAFEGTA